jgi:hypothetical protein
MLCAQINAKTVVLHVVQQTHMPHVPTRRPVTVSAKKPTNVADAVTTSELQGHAHLTHVDSQNDGFLPQTSHQIT